MIAEEGGAAPGGSTYTKFADTSINAAGDIGFFGDLAIGEGVFVRPTGGPIEAAALTGGASPGGGAFFTFSDVSTVNSSGNIAFIAKVTGGPAGVFFYNSSANTVFTVALVGDSTGGGKQFCSFVNVALGGTDRVAFQAVTETTCGVSNDATTAIFREPIVLPGSFINVAEVGGATPVPTTTYAKFFDIDENDSGDVGFRAKYSGSTAGTGVFLFDAPATTPGSPTPTKWRTAARSSKAAPSTASSSWARRPTMPSSSTPTRSQPISGERPRGTATSTRTRACRATRRG